jgi:pyruvate/2-oxoglutarate dehydrogenase complex dihydrolipoamide acyltransferase (E2) component
MPIISVRIPQLGEGLQEALLVEFLKKPGDQIKRDDPIYVMETDKATTDVESPYAGTLVEWTAEPGTVLHIGTEIAKMEVAEGVKEMPAGHAPEPAASSSRAAKTSGGATSTISARETTRRGDVMIPPKTRKYLKDHNLLDQVDKIPCSGSKLMPEDVDAYLASQGSEPVGEVVDSTLFKTVPLPKSQIVLNYRLSRAAKATVPVTVMSDIDWSAIQTARSSVKATGGPTGFAMACWAVAVAMKEHEKFRSALSADGNSFKVFHHVNLGVAVALPGDEMVTAVVRKADQMTPAEFFKAYETQVEAARDGKDQADESTTLTVSNIGKAGMRIGIPAIVAPAVGTLALGEVFQQPVPDGSSFKFRPTVTATLSFDHRIANGVGAANFLNAIRSLIESFKA